MQYVNSSQYTATAHTLRHSTVCLPHCRLAVDKHTGRSCHRPTQHRLVLLVFQQSLRPFCGCSCVPASPQTVLLVFLCSSKPSDRSVGIPVFQQALRPFCWCSCVPASPQTVLLVFLCSSKPSDRSVSVPVFQQALRPFCWCSCVPASPQTVLLVFLFSSKPSDRSVGVPVFQQALRPFCWCSCVPASPVTVPHIPSCHCTLLTQPSPFKFTKIKPLALNYREVNQVSKLNARY